MTRVPTGIPGFDNILSGGLPSGKPTLLTGPPGSGKTLFSTAFACEGLRGGETAVYASFEEHPDMLLRHAEFLGNNPSDADGSLRILDMRPGHAELAATGDLELGPVRARIEHAVSDTGAARLVLDSVDSLFFIFDGRESASRELFRLLDWIRERQITTVLTSAQDPMGTAVDSMNMIPHLCDCVVSLNQVVKDNVMTRHVRVGKYRGSTHGTNVYPFIVDRDGIFVLPVTGTRLTGIRRTEFITTGVADLDEMLAGRGVQRGSVLQVSGRTGTGKTILAGNMVRAACEAGLSVTYVSFEESTPELLDNLASAGVDLATYLSDGTAKSGLLRLEPIRAVELSLEGHLVNLIRLFERQHPDMIVLDPVTSLREQGSKNEAKSAILRLVNHVKGLGTTLLFTELLPDDEGEHSTMNISSLVDTWIRLRLIESGGEFSRLIHIAKSRGISASNQVREFRISTAGLQIEVPYVGAGGMVVGTARRIREREEAREHEHLERRLENLRRQRAVRESLITLHAELDEATQRQELELLRQDIDSLERRLSSGKDDRTLTRPDRMGE